MENHKVVSRQDWLVARKDHLRREKEFNQQRDLLSQQRRDLPWVKIDKEYVFDGADGSETLSDLFGEQSQLIIYHFMYGPDWDEGCPSCSYWADNFNGINIHLNHRDINLVVVSRAKLETLDAYKKRMDWNFKWVSSFDNDFNHDYHVSFSSDEVDKGEIFYNYQMRKIPLAELPGISVFYRNPQGDVFHTYSCYSRGLDMLNGAYHYMDLSPKGRDESRLAFSMEWLRRHDQY